jgi:hypothetical protein
LGLLFSQTVELCKQLGMVTLGHIAIDGTKIKANASDAETYDNRRIDREICRWLEQSDAVDKQEDEQCGFGKTGDELPDDIKDPKKRVQKLKELKKHLDQIGPFPGIHMRKNCDKCAKSWIQTKERRSTGNGNIPLNRLLVI